jgi:hypothetical protein
LWDAKLAAASLRQAELQRADLEAADLRGASLSGAFVDGAIFQNADFEGTSTIAISVPADGKVANIDKAFTTDDEEDPTRVDKRKALAAIYTKMACDMAGAPYIARGLIRNRNLSHLGDQVSVVRSKLVAGSKAECPGADELTSDDFATLDDQIQ